MKFRIYNYSWFMSLAALSLIVALFTGCSSGSSSSRSNNGGNGEPGGLPGEGQDPGDPSLPVPPDR